MRGPRSLLLHGWPTSSTLFVDTIGPIVGHHRAVVPDLPGYGNSSKPHARYDFELFEDVIDGLLDQLGIDEVAVVGHDLGAPIAVHWALAHPERVTAIALLNPLLYPELTPEILEFVQTMLDPEKAREETSLSALADVIASGLGEGFPRASALTGRLLAPYESDAGRERLPAAAIGLSLEGFGEIAEGIGSLTVPVRGIYGEQDRILTDVAGTMARLKREVPHAEISSLAVVRALRVRRGAGDRGRALG